MVRDHLGEVRQGYNDAVKLVVHSPDQRPVRATIFDNQNGTYRLSWSPAIEGEHVVNVLLKDAHVAGSPFRVMARSGRNYRYHFVDMDMGFVTASVSWSHGHGSWILKCYLNNQLIFQKCQ